MPSILRPSVPLLLAATLLTGVGACDGDPVPETAMDREAFIEAYVDLRAATMGGSGTELTPDQRDALLEGHGVTQDDLLEFARVHGADPLYMRDVWGEVEERLDARGGGSGPPGQPDRPGDQPDRPDDQPDRPFGEPGGSTGRAP